MALWLQPDELAELMTRVRALTGALLTIDEYLAEEPAADADP